MWAKAASLSWTLLASPARSSHWYCVALQHPTWKRCRYRQSASFHSILHLFSLSVETWVSLRRARVACNAARLPVLSLWVWCRFLQVLLLIIVVTSLVCGSSSRTQTYQSVPDSSRNGCAGPHWFFAAFCDISVFQNSWVVGTHSKFRWDFVSVTAWTETLYCCWWLHFHGSFSQNKSIISLFVCLLPRMFFIFLSLITSPSLFKHNAPFLSDGNWSCDFICHAC